MNANMINSGYFTRGAMVLTKAGYVEIQNVFVDELVLTHLSDWKPIISKQKQLFKGDTYTINHIANSVPITAISDQLFLVKTIHMTGLEPLSYRLSHDMSLVAAKDLQPHKHVLCSPVIQKLTPVNITISVNSELKIINKIDYFMVGYYVGKQGNFIDVEFVPPGWSILQEFTKHINPDSPTLCNTIPEWMQTLPKNDLKDFVLGFESTAKVVSGKYNAINELVALSMQRIYAKIGVLTQIIIVGSCAFIERAQDNMHGRFYIDNQYMYIPIKHIDSSITEQNIYQVEVANENSYVIENIATSGTTQLE